MDLSVLAGLLASANEPFQSIEAKFKKAFEPSTYPGVCAILTDLAGDGFTGAIGSQVEALVAIYLCYVMSLTYSEANGALCSCLQQLDKNIREDARRLEQLKYRQTAKDFKKFARDAVDADGYRCRTATKCFLFQCLLAQVDTNQTPNKVLRQAQSVLDGMLESWAATPGPLEDKLKDLAAAERPSLVTNSIVTSASVPPVSASFCRVGPLETPLFAGEMHYILGQEPQWFIFDNKAHSKDQGALKRLVITATKQPLSGKDRQDILSLAPRAYQIGISPTTVATIAGHDAEVAAALLAHTSKPQQCIKLVLDRSCEGALSLPQLDVIILHSAKLWDQSSIAKYIQLNSEKIMSSSDPESAKSFAASLTHLAAKVKGFTLPDAKKEELKTMFAQFSSLPEVSAWLADAK